MTTPPLDIDALLADLQQLRRWIVLLVATTVGLLLTSCLGAVAVVALMVVPSSPLRMFASLSEPVAVAAVAAGSVLATWPLLLSLFAGSFVYHRRVHRIVRELGLPAPAHGIRAGLRFLLWPMLASGAVALAFLILQLSLPTPDPGDVIATIAAGSALGLGLLIPVPGLVLARVLGTDRALSKAWKLGRVDQVRDRVLRRGSGGWPLVDGRPPSLIMAEIMRLDGELAEAEKLVRLHLREVGVAPTSTLLLLAQIRADRGDVAYAEHLCAAAALILPIDPRSARLLATFREQSGRDQDAALLRDEGRGWSWRSTVSSSAI
ncbi:MAG: hypothetical protein ACI9MC_000708 [Kiritimatiellia bacterium]|jgi:hypothetical protein